MLARARREEIFGAQDGILQVRVTAPPVGGRANRVVVLLADRLRVAPSSIKIAAGERPEASGRSSWSRWRDWMPPLFLHASGLNLLVLASA